MRISSGAFHQKSLSLPSKSDSSMRPTTTKLRMQVCNICQNMLEDASILDLFAGSGAVGFELLSRGAASCVFVEHDKKAIALLHHNIEKLDLSSSCQVLAMDATESLRKLKTFSPFSIVYIDPPYDYEETQAFQGLLEAIDQTLPMVNGGYLFIEGRQKKNRQFTLPSFSLVSHRKSGQSDLWCFEKKKYTGSIFMD